VSKFHWGGLSRNEKKKKNKKEKAQTREGRNLKTEADGVSLCVYRHFRGFPMPCPGPPSLPNNVQQQQEFQEGKDCRT
jgi:hypothetical protein